MFVLAAAYLSGLDADQIASLTGRVRRVANDGYTPPVSSQDWLDRVDRYQQETSDPSGYGVYTGPVREAINDALQAGPPDDPVDRTADVRLEDYAHLCRFHLDTFLSQVSTTTGEPFPTVAARFISARAAWLTGTGVPQVTATVARTVINELTSIPGQAWLPSDDASGYAYTILTGQQDQADAHPPNGHPSRRTGQGTRNG